MKLIIVRHGETWENYENVLNGWGNNQLNLKGQEQARKVAKRLKWMKIDVAYVSDLVRTVMTAEEIIKFHPATKVQITKALREKNQGVFDGKAIEEMVKVREQSGVLFEEFRPEQGESFKDVEKRVLKLHQQVCKKHSQKTVLYVSHGAAIRALLQRVFNEPYSLDSFAKFHMNNCAVTVLEIDPKGNVKLECLNCMKHLKD